MCFHLFEQRRRDRGFGDGSPRREKAGDPVAAAGEGAVEETRQDPGAGESEEGGGPAVPPRAAQDLGERLFTGENRPVRQNEVHRLEACGLGDRGESRTGFRGSAGEIFEGAGGHGVAPDPVGGRAAHRAIRVVDQDDGACIHLPIVCREGKLPGWKAEDAFFRGNVPSVALHKYSCIRVPLHPPRLRCAPSPYLLSTPRSRRLAGCGASALSVLRRIYEAQR